MKKKPGIRPKPRLNPAGEGYPMPMRGILALGKPKDDTPYGEWAERLRDYVPQLIQMALDRNLNVRPESDKAVWAPIHALNILAILAPVEAVEPLLEVLAWDDDWVDDPTTGLFVAVGSDAIRPLEAFVEDQDHDEMARTRAISALGAIAEQHADLSDEIVAFLASFLDRDHADNVHEETLNAWAIVELCELKAADALPAIQRAFDQNRVNTTIIAPEDVERLMSDEPDTDEGVELDEVELAGPGVADGPLRLTLKCKVCGRERQYTCEKAYLDIETISRRAETNDSPLIIPERVVCPKCGAVDQYDLGSIGFFAVTAKLMAGRSGLPDPLPRLQLVNFTTERWGWLPPREALARYASEVAAYPDNAELRIGYGNILYLFGYPEAAIDQYEQALMIDSQSGDALISIAQIKSLTGPIPEAIAAYEAIERRFDDLSFAPEDREMRRAEVYDTLAQLRSGVRPAYGKRLVPIVEPQPEPITSPAPVTPSGPTPADDQDRWQAAAVRPAPGEYGKVGRNDPCPCGSGKKYKHCHGRK